MGAISRRLMLVAVAALSLAACNKGGSSAVSGDDMTMGNPKAKVTVVEYASVACPHCARFNNDVFPAFKKKYIDTGLVHYVAREALTGEPTIAAAGFLLARCAGKDKYFLVTDAIYRAQDQIFQSGDVHGVLLHVAQSAGMSEDQMNKCITDETALKALQDRVDKYFKQDGIDSTPTFIVNGKKLKPGEISLAELDAAIQPLLK